MERQEYQMTFIENDGMKFLEKKLNPKKSGGNIWTVLLLQLKKKMMQMIDFIKYFCFSVLFYLGCGLVLSVIGILWIFDQVMEKWEK